MQIAIPMLPLNARPYIQSRLIDDYLLNERCKCSEQALRAHFAPYGGADEVSFMARKTEVELSNLLDDCILLLAASARRSSILCLIHERTESNEVQTSRIFALAEFKWSSQLSGDGE